MLWTWLRSWWHGKNAQPRRVIMYTRSGCHLCDDAWALLEQAREHHGFALDQIDIDADPELTALYGEAVPVVTIDGKERFRGRINSVLLRRLLR